MSRRGRLWLAAMLSMALAHALLGRVLSGADFMAALAAARHGHPGAALLFGAFVALRLAVTLLVPAACIAWAALVGWDGVRAQLRR